MDAWLLFCTHTQEFFHLGAISGKVSVIKRGWETRLEHEVRGPARKFASRQLAKAGGLVHASQVPAGFEDTNWRRWRIEMVEEAFTGNYALGGAGFTPEAPDRERTIHWLLEQINWQLDHLVNEPNQEMWELELYLENWRLRGVFWIRQDKYVPCIALLRLLGTNSE